MSDEINEYFVDENDGIYLPKEEKEHLGATAGDKVKVIRVPDGSLLLRRSNEDFRTNNIEQLREDNETRQRLEDIERREEEKAYKERQIIADKDFE